jgi:hypothetical protein
MDFRGFFFIFCSLSKLNATIISKYELKNNQKFPEAFSKKIDFFFTYFKILKHQKKNPYLLAI